MWTILKVFIELVTTLLLFYVLVFWPRGMWDPSSPIRDRTYTACVERRSLNHWTAREVPRLQASWMQDPVPAFVNPCIQQHRVWYRVSAQ